MLASHPPRKICSNFRMFLEKRKMQKSLNCQQDFKDFRMFGKISIAPSSSPRLCCNVVFGNVDNPRQGGIQQDLLKSVQEEVVFV